MSEPRATAGLVRWTLTALRPYTARVVLLGVLLAAEIGLGTLQPWPLALVIDLLSGKPLPQDLAPYLSRYIAFGTAKHNSHRPRYHRRVLFQNSTHGRKRGSDHVRIFSVPQHTPHHPR